MVLIDASGKRVALYNVRVTLTHPVAAEWTCRRRFSDFAWLEERLHNHITDKLPRKTMFRSFKKDFLERRRTMLNTWIQQVPNVTVTLAVSVFLDGTVQPGLDRRAVTDRVADALLAT